MERINLFNPRKELERIRNFDQKVLNILRSGQYINGEECMRLETQLATYLGVSACVSTSSGTAALELILKALNLKKKTKILVTAHTFVAVVEAILNSGHVPEFLDLDELSWQMPCINGSEEILLVSHLYGGVAPALDSRCHLLIEDCAQSVGAVFREKKLGSFGMAAGISLYPTKNLGALGDAGIISTNDEALAVKLRALRNHGQTRHQYHQYLGTTARMDEVQALVLREKLCIFDDLLAERRRIAEYYSSALRHLPLEMPDTLSSALPAPNLFVISVENRGQLKEHLNRLGIDCGTHYPVPIHKIPAYRQYRWAKVSLPITERLLNQILTVPLWVGMSSSQLDRVVEAIYSFFKT